MPKDKGNGLPLGAFNAAPETYFEGLSVAAQLMEPWFKAWARGNLELMTLASRRARAYLELPEKLGRCRSPQDLVHEGVCFWQAMAEDYTESSRRLAGGWSAIMQQPRSSEPEARERDYVTFPESGDTKQDAAREGSPRRAA